MTEEEKKICEVDLIKKQTSLKNVLNDIETFSNFSELCPNFEKCEIVGIGFPKM